MDTVGLMTVFASEVTGTAVLILLGVGVVANVLLAQSGGLRGGYIRPGAGAADAARQRRRSVCHAGQGRRRTRRRNGGAGRLQHRHERFPGAPMRQVRRSPAVGDATGYVVAPAVSHLSLSGRVLAIPASSRGPA